ncbi:MAG TPA: DnaA/Hda family protein [Longimicrobiales bacterium]|nr:DnaA/Hda family protein [Longimicrobiales bacterium]
MTELDPRLTFDNFVVGPANRLASAAARRSAESPGTSYNPLFLYASSGLGKSHILHAIAHQSMKSAPGRRVDYLALEVYLEELTAALESGKRDAFREKFSELDVLLLDDVQFLTGQNEAQEMLLRTLDQLSAAGSQIVLASDRPPAEIDGLDARLLSRFSGGLIVDIGAPEYETRVAIIRKKADERGQSLATGVAEAVARYPFKNIRELGGALNKVFATQDLDERRVTAEEVARLLGDEEPQPVEQGADEFGSFLDDLTGAVAETVQEQEEPWRKAMRQAVDVAEREGFSAGRIRSYQGGREPEGWERFVEQFLADIQRLRDIENELDRLENPWPEAAQGLLRDPERLSEAEALLTSVRERQRPFRKLGEGAHLHALKEFPNMALKAAQQLVGAEKPQYNPLYLWSEKSDRGLTLLGAAGRTFQAANPEARMAVTSVKEFAEDFIRALGEGVAGAWRERWWTVDLLLVHGVEALSDTERAQDEFFHLFEALKRRGARVMLVADRSPSGIGKIDERLRSRFEGGLVLEVDAGAASGELELVEPPAQQPRANLWDARTARGERLVPPLDEFETGDRAGLFLEPGTGAPEAEVPAAHEADPSLPLPAGPRPIPVAGNEEDPAEGGPWIPSAESVVIQWPRIEELLQEELD